MLKAKVVIVFTHIYKDDFYIWITPLNKKQRSYNQALFGLAIIDRA